MNKGTHLKGRIAITFGIAALLFFAGYAALFIAPDEATMHEVQRIFYFHLPAWMTSFTAFTIVFISNIAYLNTKRLKWDCLGVAAAEVGVVCCSIGLITGPLVGPAGMGHLVDVGCAPDHHVHPVAAVYLISAAARVAGRSAEARFAFGGFRHFRVSGRAAGVCFQPALADAASAARIWPGARVRGSIRPWPRCCCSA